MSFHSNSTVFLIDKNFEFTYQKKKISKLFSLFKRNNQTEWKLLIKNDDINIINGFVAVLGESGSGKSTLVSILSGFEKLSSDNAKKIKYVNHKKFVHYGSKKIKTIKKDCFGFIFQRCYESKSLNASDNIAMPLFNKLYSVKSIKKYCLRLLESLNLSHVSNSPANELSGGQLTRIGILRGIAQTPNVIFADEPANNLDKQNAGLILNILKNWREQSNGTVIMVTHHLEHAFRFADQIIVLQSTSQHTGEIVYQKVKTGDDWSESEKKKINEILDVSDNNQTQFPSPPVLDKKGPFGYIFFLIKIAWANISSKADGSRTISLITLYSFFLLFFIIFSGNLVVQWFTHVDNKKNNAAYLRQFEISVAHPPGLSKNILSKINSTTVDDLKFWIANKINKTYNKLYKLSEQLKIKNTHQYLSWGNDNQFDFSLLTSEQPVEQIEKKFKDYGYFLSAYIKNHSLKTFNVKQLKAAEKIVHKLIRYTEFYLDIVSLEGSSRVCTVYPRWESGPEFVKKNGVRRNLTTTMRWLDYRDPFFNDPRINYINNKNFRFNSNEDEGIIIDVETLVHDLGYDVVDKEIRVLYGNMEKACVPIKAVVERMPESGKYHVLTTFGFGEKLRSASHHCEDKKKFYQFHLKFRFNISDVIIKNVFSNKKNRDAYDNIQVNYSKLSDNLFEIYCDYDIAKTKINWIKWVSDNFESPDSTFSLIFNKNWEVPGKKEKDPPYTDGTVYSNSVNAVRALGEYLSQAYQEHEDYYDRCLINAYDYEEKIQFAKQSATLLSWIKVIGSIFFGILFFIFLGTNMMVTIRNKASEIAIFQAMGGTLFSLLLIYNIQMILLILIAAIIAIITVFIFLPYIQTLFISYIIQSIWTKLDDQRDVIVDITANTSLDNFFSIVSTNQEILLCSIVFMLIIVSISIFYVKVNSNYSVSKILKER